MNLFDDVEGSASLAGYRSPHRRARRAGGRVHDHDRGLSWDLLTLMTRRRALQLAAAGGLAAVVGCGSSQSSGDATGATSSATTAAPTTPSAAATVAGEIPEETAGPFPADGSNGPDVLAESGIVRADITSSFGGVVRQGGGGPVDDRPDGPRRRGRWGAGRGGGRLHLALRPRGAVLDLRVVRRRPELPPRGPGLGRRRPARLHQHLARRLPGALAPHPLRGLPEPRRGDRRRQPSW